MDFLKRVVPPILPGDAILDTSESIQENFPRLLKMRRLSLVSSEKTVDQQDGTTFHPSHAKCKHQQLGKVNQHCFESSQKIF